MSPPLIVLRPDDAARVAALHAVSAHDPWPAHAYRSLLQQSTCLGLGICEETSDQLKAFLVCQMAVDTGDLLMVATHPDHRRKSLARTLIHALLKRLGERGAARLTLDVAADNERAIALYTSMGFAEDGRRPNYYTRGPSRMDAILMSRAVTGLPPRKKA